VLFNAGVPADPLVALAAVGHEVRTGEDEPAAVDRLSQGCDAEPRHQRQAPVARSVHLPGEVDPPPWSWAGRSGHGGPGRRDGRDRGERASRHDRYSERATGSKVIAQRGGRGIAEHGTTAAIRGRVEKVVADCGEVIGQGIDGRTDVELQVATLERIRRDE